MTIKTESNGLIPKTALQEILGKQAVVVHAKLANVIGVTKSICWQQLNYWINNKSTTTLFEGRLWIYNTYKQWQQQLPFYSEITIKKSFHELEKMGLVLSRWEGLIKYYTIDYQALDSLLKTDETYVEDDYFDMNQNDSKEDKIYPTTDKIYPTTDKKYPGDGYNISDDRIKNIRSYIDTKTTLRLHREEEHSASANSAFSENASPPKELEKAFKKKKRAKGTYLPDDWVLPPEYRNWSLQVRMKDDEIDLTEVRFRNYWLSTTKSPTKTDWFATWQNWCLGDYNLKKGGHLKLPPKLLSVLPVQPSKIKQSDNPKIQKWNELQPLLRDRVGEDNYISWLKNLELIKTDGRAVFKADTKFIAGWISTNYLSDLSAILSMVDPILGIAMNIEFEHSI